MNQTNTRQFLHVGCGQKRQDRTTPGFAATDWREIRLDIDPKAQPDIVGTMTDMSQVPAGHVQGLYSSHNIEHLYPHEVPQALSEFHRVLSADGIAVITCPDLQAVCDLVAKDRLLEPAYQSPAGPISAIDMLYGHRPAMAAGNLYMAHRTGFTLRSLMGALQKAGFQTCIGRRQPAPGYALWALASKQKLDEGQARALAAQHFPKV